MARLQRVAMTRGRGPVRTREESSPNVTSRTQWTLFYRPVAADVAGDVGGGCLAGVQAGDDEHRDGGLDGLLRPALSLLHAHDPGHVPFDQGDLAGVREPRAD